MKLSRRKFLKLSGTCILGLGAVQLFSGKDFGSASSLESSPGTRLAMVVDTRKCKEDCEDCILACHRVHNVPDIDDREDEVKWIWKEEFAHAFPNQQHQFASEVFEGRSFMVMCNHCDNPACVRVCPTKATFKREDGIVAMDYHRCIGCRYCMAACPYGARSFNFRDPRPFIKEENPEFPTRTKGVVEKCNFCVERLAVGSPPACVEACKYGALLFGDIGDPDSEVRKILHSNHTILRKPDLGTLPNVYYIV